ncbi:SoxR reducing system RseC family protein [uncultured Peptoniphilus sp.]|uniref:SoxR reducing system RseC family protein n=1 Tax=uncultured Peptoniphilus sp. TaxID=254354 RepID=UPI0025F6BC5B|nr:SoxR reducing system RseC family protein [uncultured Peptoniphilus sp.]
MESIGIVRDKKENKIFVEFTRESACGDSCESCNAKCAESEQELFEFNNTISAKVGDIVKIKTNDRSVLSYKFLVYGLPLVLFMSTITISYYFFNNMGLDNKDLFSLIVGILSFILSFIILRTIDNKNRQISGASILLEKM